MLGKIKIATHTQKMCVCRHKIFLGIYIFKFLEIFLQRRNETIKKMSFYGCIKMKYFILNSKMIDLFCSFF